VLDLAVSLASCFIFPAVGEFQKIYGIAVVWLPAALLCVDYPRDKSSAQMVRNRRSGVLDTGMFSFTLEYTFFRENSLSG
jgi:hypothetical protein